MDVSINLVSPSRRYSGRAAASLHQILLQMPGLDDPERVKALIGSESHLQLMKVADNSDPGKPFPSEEAAKAALGGTVPPNRVIYPFTERDTSNKQTQQPADQKPDKFLILETPAIVDGSELRDASPSSRTGSDYNIDFHLKPAGAQAFGEWTGKNIGKYLAIVLNNQVKSAPVIKGQIFDTGTIEGKFTKESADDLALTLKSGALPAPIEYVEEVRLARALVRTRSGPVSRHHWVVSHWSSSSCFSITEVRASTPWSR